MVRSEVSAFASDVFLIAQPSRGSGRAHAPMIAVAMTLNPLMEKIVVSIDRLYRWKCPGDMDSPVCLGRSSD